MTVNQTFLFIWKFVRFINLFKNFFFVFRLNLYEITFFLKFLLSLLNLCYNFSLNWRLRNLFTKSLWWFSIKILFFFNSFLSTEGSVFNFRPTFEFRWPRQFSWISRISWRLLWVNLKLTNVWHIPPSFPRTRLRR